MALGTKETLLHILIEKNTLYGNIDNHTAISCKINTDKVYIYIKYNMSYYLTKIFNIRCKQNFLVKMLDILFFHQHQRTLIHIKINMIG